jgi:hypothetical protein
MKRGKVKLCCVSVCPCKQVCEARRNDNRLKDFPTKQNWNKRLYPCSQQSRFIIILPNWFRCTVDTGTRLRACACVPVCPCAFVPVFLCFLSWTLGQHPEPRTILQCYKRGQRCSYFGSLFASTASLPFFPISYFPLHSPTMRLPTVILLSSALALLVRAEEPSTAVGAKVDIPLATPAPIKRIESLAEIPVGKGIVYSKTTFFTDDKKEDKETMTGTDFAANLLGINLGINIGGNAKTKKNNTHGEDKSPDYVWNNLPLYGDDNYTPRPVPAGCDELSFLDQMVKNE